MISFSMFFFFNDTATTEIYTLSLHDALPIWPGQRLPDLALMGQPGLAQLLPPGPGGPGSDGPRRRGPCRRTGAGHPRPPRPVAGGDPAETAGRHGSLPRRHAGDVFRRAPPDAAGAWAVTPPGRSDLCLQPSRPQVEPLRTGGKLDEGGGDAGPALGAGPPAAALLGREGPLRDRKSTRLNS